MRYFFSLLISLVKLFLTLLVFLTPLLGVWLVSSLVAYINGPIWLSLLSGILLFPLLPLTWELQAMWRRRKRGHQDTPILTFSDRLTLRTLTLNLLFIGCLLALRPETAFIALSTRGDWMLDSMQGSQVESIRRGLFQVANSLEGLYVAVRHNPYQQYATTTNSTQIKPQPNFKDPFQAVPIQIKPSSQPSVTQQNSRYWPWEGSTLHPAVASMPASVEISIESIARYIASKESDPFLRVKALHDYVADRITYDTPAYLKQIPRPPQDAQTVFTSRKAVCAGYANLLAALGKAIGEEIVYITGDARTRNSNLNGQGHAWNAAKIQGSWYLIDATWDSGYVNSSQFTKEYRSDYLFAPPEVFIITHFPDEEAWQLLPNPLSRGDFLRQPMLRPRFFAEGMKLVSPNRSQTEVQNTAVIQLENPRQRWLMATFSKKGEEASTKCNQTTDRSGQIFCSFPATGTYEVKLFSGSQQYGKYAYLGQLEFNKR